MTDFAQLLESEKARLAQLQTPTFRDKLNATLQSIGSSGKKPFNEALAGIIEGRAGGDIGMEKGILGNLLDRQQLGIREREITNKENEEARKQFELAVKQGDATAKRIQELFPGLTVDDYAEIAQEMSALNNGRDPAGLKQIDSLASQAGENLGIQAPRIGDIGPTTDVLTPGGVRKRRTADVVAEGLEPAPTRTLTGPISADVTVPPPAAETSILPENVDIALGTGVAGALGTAINKVTDFFGAGLAFPSVTQATEALTDLGVNTKIVLQAQVPGRPSNLLLEQFDKVQVKPGKLLTGKAESMSRLAQTRNLIATELNRIDSDILSNPSAFLPKEISDTRVNRSQLGRLLEAYDQVLKRVAEEPVDLSQFLNAR